MTENRVSSAEGMKKEALPRRDWILLPMLALLTVVFLAGSTELVARKTFSESTTGIEKCMVVNDPSTGVRGIPNTVCWEKSPESPNIEFRFNGCGHRAGMECEPKPAGTYRIVMMGSSVAMGMRVRQNESFAALLPVELSKLTGRRVELYNESMGWGFPHSTALRFNQVLAAKPDMILWILTPMDVEKTTVVVAPVDVIGDDQSISLAVKAWRRAKEAVAAESLSTAMGTVFSRTRTALMLRHYLYASQSQYVKAFLAGSDDETGYLKGAWSDEWKNRLISFDADAAEMERQAHAAGIPFVAAYVPERAQVAMISIGEWPAGFDPYKLDDELRSTIVRYGGIYTDILPQFKTIAHPERLYFAVDGHPNPAGHAVISGLLAKSITSDALSALKAAQPELVSAEKGR